uniref:(northern house mosquito) hypothetical protein n=1 Tax=Culex pipiens TaxID=7175 RepID=A0A8D8G3U4_CULPI
MNSTARGHLLHLLLTETKIVGPKMTDDDICTEGTNRHRSRPAALDHWTKHAGARGMLGVNNLRKINAGGEKVWTTAEARGIRLLRGGAREWKCWPVGPR